MSWHLGDEGMTLVELIIAVAVLVLVVTPLTMVLGFALSASNAASQRTTDSSGAQLMSAYFVTDVQGADFVWTASHQTPFTTAPFTSQCGTVDTIAELQSRDATTSAVTSVTYDTVPPALGTGNTSLVRRTWTVSGGTCSKTDSSTLIDALDPSNPAQVDCVPASCSSPDTVQISVDALSQDVHNSALYSAYTFTLTAARRVG